MEIHNPRRFVRPRVETPFLDRVQRRIREYRMTADQLRALNRPIGRDRHLKLHYACDVHAPRQVRICRRHLELRFPTQLVLTPRLRAVNRNVSADHQQKRRDESNRRSKRPRASVFAHIPIFMEDSTSTYQKFLLCVTFVFWIG
jgi:hypothetical protein